MVDFKFRCTCVSVTRETVTRFKGDLATTFLFKKFLNILFKLVVTFFYAEVNNSERTLVSAGDVTHELFKWYSPEKMDTKKLTCER